MPTYLHQGFHAQIVQASFVLFFFDISGAMSLVFVAVLPPLSAIFGTRNSGAYGLTQGIEIRRKHVSALGYGAENPSPEEKSEFLHSATIIEKLVRFASCMR